MLYNLRHAKNLKKCGNFLSILKINITFHNGSENVQFIIPTAMSMKNHSKTLSQKRTEETFFIMSIFRSQIVKIPIRE